MQIKNNLALVPQKTCTEVIERLERVERLLQQRTSNGNEDEWLESGQVRKILHISTITWQNWRNKRVIPFVQFGRKILVKKSDLDAYMQAHTMKKKGGVK